MLVWGGGWFGVEEGDLCRFGGEVRRVEKHQYNGAKIRLFKSSSKLHTLPLSLSLLVVHCPLWEIRVVLPVSAVFWYVRTIVRLTVFGIYNALTHVDACDCTRGLYEHRESLPCRTGDSNPRLYCSWLFSRTFYHLSYPHSDPGCESPQTQETV